MTSPGKTLNRLHSLETLYRNGYQSDMLDQSLEKIVRLELHEAQRECAALETRLQGFEAQYQLASPEFYQQFQASARGDSAEMVEWSIFYEMWCAVKERVAVFQAMLEEEK
jgi:hypothetical protein